MTFNAKKNTYASSPPVRVNGADVRMQVKPEGTANGSFAVSAMVYSAAVATLEGPFRWRLEALGRTGHETLVVHRIRTRTSKTTRDEWFPPNHLGKWVAFKPRKDFPATTRAVYPIPGLLQVDSVKDGALEVSVDLTVTSGGERVRKMVEFQMNPSKTRQDEFVFLPTEIVKGIRTPVSEWGDEGWD